MNEVEISEKLTQLNKELSKINITDFCIYDYATRLKLLLAGSNVDEIGSVNSRQFGVRVYYGQVTCEGIAAIHIR